MSKKSRRKAAAGVTLGANRNPPRLGLLLGGLAALVVIAGAVFVVNVLFSNSPTLLAATDGQAQGQTVDGISCDTSEQVVYHIHAHLAVYTNGRPRIIPEGIGIVPPTQVVQTSAGPFVVAGTCFYWLHSHTVDGIIHVESPSQRVYTLGNYFDIWNQPLNSTQVGPAHGQVTAYVDGQPFTGDPRSIPLNPHTLIQLDVGTASPGPQPFTFPPGL
ncbi:MAG TPA: hypothetical protein VN895_01310 [Candidatus Acidoferrum sp.]|nr:hypothetical protein [Candidatus Acidoferrum sp.]